MGSVRSWHRRRHRDDSRGLLTYAAAPALQAAAPSNDPALAGQELLEPQFGEDFHVHVARTRPSLARTRPLQPQLRSRRSELDGLRLGSQAQPRQRAPFPSQAPSTRAEPRRPRRRRRDRRRSPAPIPRPLVRAGRYPGRPGRGRGLELEELQRYSLGAELGLRRLQVRTTGTTMFPRARSAGDRRATAGWLRSGNRCPDPVRALGLVWANRFWQIDMDGETVSTRSRQPAADAACAAGDRDRRGDRGGRSLLVRPAPVVPAARRLRHHSKGAVIQGGWPRSHIWAIRPCSAVAPVGQGRCGLTVEV